MNNKTKKKEPFWYKVSSWLEVHIPTLNAVLTTALQKKYLRTVLYHNLLAESALYDGYLIAAMIERDMYLKTKPKVVTNMYICNETKSVTNVYLEKALHKNWARNKRIWKRSVAKINRLLPGLLSGAFAVSHFTKDQVLLYDQAKFVAGKYVDTSVKVPIHSFPEIGGDLTAWRFYEVGVNYNVLADGGIK